MQGLPPLAVGEVVPALIMESRGGQQAVLLVKGSLVTAQSDLPLKRGERRMLVVEKLTPQVVFKVLSGNGLSTSHVNDALRHVRMHPQSIFQMFSEAHALLRERELSVLTDLLGKNDAEKLISLIRSLVYSGNSRGEPYFLKDYLERIGFLMEHELAGAVAKRFGKAGKAQSAAETLKALLMSMGEKLRTAEAGQSRVSLGRRIGGFINDSLKAIETHQVLNSMLQECERAYVFQVPLHCAAQIRMAEICITLRDESGEGHDEERGVTSVQVFLDLDSLGPLLVKTSIAAVTRSLECRIICDSDEASQCISPFLHELDEGLTSATGCRVKELTCSVGDVGTERRDVVEDYMNSLRMEVVDVVV